MRKLSGLLAGAAGEYLVAAELFRHGWVAALTRGNIQGIDILASTESASRSVGIQVKTRQGKRTRWPLSKKAEDNVSDSLFYVFVNLNDGGQPDFYVLPSQVVASSARKAFNSWKEKPGRHGQPRDPENPIRMLDSKELKKFCGQELGDYRDRWGLLGLEDGSPDAPAERP